jgi:hypothetical protein
MATVATVLALGVEKVGTSSVARRITHIVLVEVRTAKVEAHLAERHLVKKKVDVLNKKLILRNVKNIHNQFFLHLTIIKQLMYHYFSLMQKYEVKK